MGDAIDWRHEVGDERIMTHLKTLAWQGGQELASRWGTESLVSAAMTPGMVNIRLPTDNRTLAFAIVDRLRERYNTYLVVYELQNRFYTRVSAQVYLDLSSFQMLAMWVLDVLKG